MKNFEISLISLEVLVGIGRGNLSILAGLLVSLSLVLPSLIGITFEMQLYDTFCLKVLLCTSAISECYSMVRYGTNSRVRVRTSKYCSSNY